MLRRLGEIDRRRVAWDHHMNFPDCALNPHPGRWATTVESEEGTLSERYDDVPTDILRVVEVLCFRNLASKTSASSEVSLAHTYLYRGVGRLLAVLLPHRDSVRAHGAVGCGRRHSSDDDRRTLAQTLAH